MRYTQYGNKGMGLELELNQTCEHYKTHKWGNVEKVPTPVKVMKAQNTARGLRITDGYFEKKAFLDYRGTLTPGIPISFDAKECEDMRGLLLEHIQDHQMEAIRAALEVGEISFIITYIKPINKRFLVPGPIVSESWALWKANYRKRGFNYIPIDKMIEVKSGRGAILDFAPVVQGLAFNCKMGLITNK